MFHLSERYYFAYSHISPAPVAQVVQHPLQDREVTESIPGGAIPHALKMVPVATLLGAQRYRTSTGFSSPIDRITCN